MTKDMIEVRPLAPFVGSYRCSLADADMVDEDLVERDGVVIKHRVPRKRYIGLIPVQRALRADERDLLKAGGKLPETFEVLDESGLVIERPASATLRLPAEIAQSLVERGLAEIVRSKGR
jgi:hypothetical protein